MLNGTEFLDPPYYITKRQRSSQVCLRSLLYTGEYIMRTSLKTVAFKIFYFLNEVNWSDYRSERRRLLLWENCKQEKSSCLRNVYSRNEEFRNENELKTQNVEGNKKGTN